MTTTTQLRNPHTKASPRSTRTRKQTLHLGTFADGQRAAPLTVTYSVAVGSFGHVRRK
jgi:hypothetical protein